MNKLRLTLALALTALGLSAGCSKSEKPAPIASAPSQTAPQASEAPQAIAGVFPPLTPETQAIIASNKTAVVYHQVFYLTNSTISDLQKSMALMQMLPDFDTDGQRAVAHAAVKYVADSNHILVSKPLIEGKLDPQILSIFMTDTLKRPDVVRLPVLKALAEAETHRMKAEATDFLAALTNKPETAQKQVAN